MVCGVLGFFCVAGAFYFKNGGDLKVAGDLTSLQLWRCIHRYSGGKIVMDVQ